MKAFSQKKTIMIIHCIFSVLLLITCEKTKNNTDNLLDGEWKLMSYECCDLPKEDFSKGEIVWDFNAKSNSVAITNNITIEESSQYNFKESGLYSLQIQESKLMIFYKDKERDFNYSIRGDTLTLEDSPESDGPGLIFEK